MAQDWNTGRQGSMQDYPREYYYSTSYSSGNGRSASTDQEQQYQNFSPQSHLIPPVPAQGSLSQLHNGQSGSWQNAGQYLQQSAEPQRTSATFDAGELHQLARPVDDPPFTAAFRQPHGARQQQLSQLSFPTPAPKAYTVAAGALSPSLHRLTSFDTRVSVPSPQDSGFESHNTSWQDFSRNPQDVYQFRGDPRHAYAPSAPPGPESVQSEPVNADPTSRRKRPKLPPPPCPTCHKDLKNQSDARYA